MVVSGCQHCVEDIWRTFSILTACKVQTYLLISISFNLFIFFLYILNISFTIQVLEAVVGWLKHDWENRKCHTVSLLCKVRLGTIKSTKLDELIDQEMRAIDGCLDILRVVEEKKNEGDPSPVQPPLSVTMPDMFSPRGTVHVSMQWIHHVKAFTQF